MGPATWAVARARLPQEVVCWRQYQLRAGESPDALAELAHHVAPPPSGSNPLPDVLTHMHHAPLAALESHHGVPHAVWTFAWHEALLNLELPAHIYLHASGDDRVAQAPAPFRHALAQALAQVLAQRQSWVAVHGGVLHVPPCPDDGALSHPAEFHRLQVHTNKDECVVQVSSTYEPWTRLDMRARPGESVPRHVELGHTQVCLVPTLQHATLLHTLAAPDDTACAALAARLATPLSHIGGPAEYWAAVRVSMAWPPPEARMDAVALSVPPHTQRETAVPCQLLWPAALCLVVDTPTPPPSLALLQKSAIDLLASAAWPSDRAPSPLAPETMGPVVGIGAPLPPPLSPVEDDVFQGIGQLTDDDLSFFGARAPTEPGPISPEREECVSSQAPPEPPSLPTLEVSEPPRAPLAVKYDMHGKFFVGNAYRRISEHDIRSGVSPRALYLSTPQSAMHNSPSQGSGWDEPEDASDEAPCLPAAQSALISARFHTPLSDVAVPAPPTNADALTERVHLEWTCAYAGAARHPWAPTRLPPTCSALSTAGTATRLPTPSVLVGCQAALMQVEPEALRAWSSLGLQPSGGKRSVVAHVALLEVEVPEPVLPQWLAGGADVYAAHGLGTLTPGEQWRYQGGLWVDGMPHVPESPTNKTERHVVFLVYDQPKVCERLYRTWPMPRSRIALIAVPLGQIMPMKWPRALAYAAYEDAHARVCHLAPSTYQSCTHLRERLHWDAQWPRAEPAVSPLHSGAVLHVAYDRQGGVVRLVATDERAWLQHVSAWDATEEAADVAQLWHIVRSWLAGSAARWHVVVCRYGAMPSAEVAAWKAWKAQARWEADALGVTLLSLHPQGPRAILKEAPWAWTASTTGMAMHADTPVLVPHTAYVSAGEYALHWLQCDEPDTLLHDVIVHLYALQTITQLRWPAPAPLLPWHMAVLAHA